MIQATASSFPHSHKLPLDRAGIGFKPVYFDEIMDGDHAVGWLEIHAENYMIDGGPILKQLEMLRTRYPVSCHGVGLSIGSTGPLDREHLARLKYLVGWLEPAVFSEHLAWSSHGQNYFNDLLPLPYTRETLDRVVEHIDQVQETLGRRMLLENPSLYIDFDCHEMSETDFIQAIIKRTGCGLLLDINNVYVSSVNQSIDPLNYLAGIPFQAVGEIHLAGHATDKDDKGATLLIDSHNTTVADPVWALYRDVIACHGAMPTLIEWDGNLPDFRTLENEALTASLCLGDALKQEQRHVAR